MAQLDLDRIKIHKLNDPGVGGHDDEVEVIVDGDVVWDKKMGKGDGWVTIPTAHFPFDGTITVEIRERDGRRTKTVGQPWVVSEAVWAGRGQLYRDFSLVGTHYELSCEVHA